MGGRNTADAANKEHAMRWFAITTHNPIDRRIEPLGQHQDAAAARAGAIAAGMTVVWVAPEPDLERWMSIVERHPHGTWFALTAMGHVGPIRGDYADDEAAYEAMVEVFDALAVWRRRKLRGALKNALRGPGSIAEAA